MLELFTFVLAAVASGYALRKAGVVRAELAKDLNQLVFYLTLPPLVFMALHGAALSWDMLTMPALGWGLSLAGLALGLGVARALKLPPGKAGALVVAVAFGNTTFFGYPIIEGLYGREALTLAVFYDLLGTTLAVNLLGTAVAAAFASRMASRPGEAPAPGWLAMRRLALFPPIWALALGLILRGLTLPPLLTGVLEQLGALTVPLIMISIGLSLQFRHWRQDWPLVAFAAASRLVLLPLAMWAAVRGLGLPAAYVQVAVMEAAMPTMFFSLTLALLFGLEVNVVVNAIMASTLLSFLTLPLWHALLM